tara:strand:+ start:370 stop:810 length:441 start_codon:yes stop_codon:yes gene_type:complete
MKVFISIICLTNWICTSGGGKTFLTPYSSINQSNYYTEHHIDFGDGSDTTFIGIHNPTALAYQAIGHTYDLGIYIATLTTSFYDSTTNALICTSTKQDTICKANTTCVNENKKSIRYKVYNIKGIQLSKEPKKGMYIKNGRAYYKL